MVSVRQFVFLLAALCLIASQANGLEFSDSTGSVSTDQKITNLTYTSSDLDGGLTVSYYKNGSLVNSSGDSSSDYRIEFNSSVADSFKVFNLTAVASNSSSYSNESREIILKVDTAKPEIQSNSLDYSRGDDGSINVSFTVDETGTGLKKIELVRRNNGTDRTVDTVEPGKDSGDFELVDANEEDVYGEEFDYTVNVEDEVGNTDSYDYDASVSPKDRIKPELTSVNPEDGATINNKETGNFTATLRDQLSGLQAVNLSLGTKKIEVTNIDSENRTVSMDISSFDDSETFTADIEAEDNAGNTVSFTKKFTTDRTPPNVGGDIFPDQDFIQSETTLGIDVSGEDTGEVDKVVCYLGDEELETDTRPNNNDVYSCGKVNPAEYKDGEKTLYAKYYDEVGNSNKVEIGSWIFDTGKPEIKAISIVPEYGWKAPEVNVDVKDKASEIEEVEYWFDAYTERETVDDIPDLKSTDVSFEPEVEGFSGGTHTLNIRVSDRTGKWSEVKQVDYHLKKSQRPKPKLNYSPIELSSNSSETFRATLRNSGQVGMLSTTLNFSDVLNGSKKIKYIPRSSSESLDITVTPRKNTGLYNSTLNLESSTQNKNYNIKTVIRATETEEKQLESRIESLKESLEGLKENYSRIDKKRVGEKRQERVLSEIQQLNHSLNRLKDFSREDKHYLVAENIEEAENKSRSAKRSVENLREYHNQLEILFYAGIGLIPVLLLGGVYLARYENVALAEQLKNRLFPIFNKPYRFSKSLVPRSQFNSFYRSIRYSQFGTAVAVKSYRVKRKLKKLLKRDGVNWKGYH